MMMVTRLLAAIALSTALIAVGLPAQAQWGEKCQADVEKLCAKVERGQGRIIQCLNEHSADLSADCKKAMEEAKARRRKHAGRSGRGRKGGGMRRVCNTDIEKFCKSALGKRQEMANCLNGHKSELTSECRERVEQVVKRLQQRAAGKDKENP